MTSPESSENDQSFEYLHLTDLEVDALLRDTQQLLILLELPEHTGLIHQLNELREKFSSISSIEASSFYKKLQSTLFLAKIVIVRQLLLLGVPRQEVDIEKIPTELETD